MSSMLGPLNASAPGTVNTKFGMCGFALALREDMRPHNVGVSTVFPGYISDAGNHGSSATVPCSPTPAPPCHAESAPAHHRTWHARPYEPSRITSPKWTIAPLSLRLGARLGGTAPDLTAAIQRRLGVNKTTERLAEGERDKR
jgi:NAD(P)-dependent dehydrogenase (short-subunit alcohol dehydrogenase family)